MSILSTANYDIQDFLQVFGILYGDPVGLVVGAIVLGAIGLTFAQKYRVANMLLYIAFFMMILNGINSMCHCCL